jgi:hypothetical protein
MKKIFFFLFSISCFSQAPIIVWQKSFGGSQQDIPFSIQQANDGGYISAGYTLSNDQDVTNFHGGEGDFWVVKTDANGNLQWQKTYGGSDYEYAFDIEKTTDNGYIIAGYTKSNNGDITLNKGVTDYWVVKINANGIIQWQKTFGGSSIDYAFSIKQTTDGGYILLGETLSTNGDVVSNHGSFDIWVLKLSSTGAIQWKKTYGGTGGDYASSINLTSDGGYIIGGNTYSNDGDVTGYHSDRDYWIIKINSTGVIQWQKTLGGSEWDDLRDIQQTSDGGYIAVGRSLSSNGNISNYNGGVGWVVKLSSTGTLQWEKSLGNNLYVGLESVKEKSGGYVIAGSIYGDIYGYPTSSNYWIIKINNSGTLIWEKTMGGSEIDTASSIILTSDGGFAITGKSNSLNGDITDGNSIYDFWIVKLSGETLSILDNNENKISIFPNPTKNILNINLNNNLSIQKTIVTDMVGKILINQSSNSNQINTENLLAGTYLIQVFSGENKYHSKFIKE